MHTKLDTLCGRFGLTPRQKEFCANLSNEIGKPDLDLLDESRLSATMKADKLCLALPHRHDPCLTILTVISPMSLSSLQVWGLEFADCFDAMIRHATLGKQNPDAWALRVVEFLRGKMHLEKWTKAGTVYQTRTSRYSSEVGKWTIGHAARHRQKRFFGFSFALQTAGGKSLPPGCVHEEKHVVFSTNHGIPKLVF